MARAVAPEQAIRNAMNQLGDLPDVNALTPWRR
jgi:hypothetical protein